MVQPIQVNSLTVSGRPPRHTITFKYSTSGADKTCTFKIMCRLGGGTFGSVWHVQDDGGVDYAMKQMELYVKPGEDVKPDDTVLFLDEAKMEASLALYMQRLGVGLPVRNDGFFYVHWNGLFPTAWIVMEKADDNLLDYMTYEVDLDTMPAIEEQLERLLRKQATAGTYCFDHKLENVLYKWPNDVFLSDFGGAYCCAVSSKECTNDMPELDNIRSRHTLEAFNTAYVLFSLFMLAVNYVSATVCAVAHNAATLQSGIEVLPTAYTILDTHVCSLAGRTDDTADAVCKVLDELCTRPFFEPAYVYTKHLVERASLGRDSTPLQRDAFRANLQNQMINWRIMVNAYCLIAFGNGANAHRNIRDASARAVQHANQHFCDAASSSNACA